MIIDRNIKVRFFFPICHFCGVKGYIQPICFILMNFLENYYEKTNFSRYFQKHTHRLKIDLGNESKKKWVKKSELKCFVSYTYLGTYATNSWYFDSGCSRHMMGKKDILVN